MSRHILLPLLAVTLVACGDGELRAPITAQSTNTAAPGAMPEPRAIVREVASKPSFEMDAPPLAETGNLCTYRKRQAPVMQGYADRTGAQWEGEVTIRSLPNMDTKWFGPFDKRLATMVARPRIDVFRVRIDDNCLDPQTKKYYSCTKVLEADLSKVRGFARALTPERARALAVQLCEKKVAEIVADSAQIRQESIDTRCHVYEQAFCELPPAPPPPPAPAKKK
ncbi:MAG: hypothetical protein U1F37_16275 [Alphaproteobacteria bacterium]